MEGRNQDCYLWIDESVPEDERTMNVLCMECSKQFPGLGWFWEGSRLGYGPFEFTCKKCGHIVHQAPKSQNSNE